MDLDKFKLDCTEAINSAREVKDGMAMWGVGGKADSLKEYMLLLEVARGLAKDCPDLDMDERDDPSKYDVVVTFMRHDVSPLTGKPYKENQ